MNIYTYIYNKKSNKQMFILTSSYPDHGPILTGCGLLGFFRLLLGGACTVRDLRTASQRDAHGKVGGSFGKDPESIIVGVLGCAFVPLLAGRNEAAALKRRCNLGQETSRLAGWGTRSPAPAVGSGRPCHQTARRGWPCSQGGRRGCP